MAIKKNTVSKPEEKVVAPDSEKEVSLVANPSMGKKEMVTAIKERIVAKGKAAPVGIITAVIESFEEQVIECVSTGIDVNMIGFMKIYTQLQPERQARNPSTGEVFMSPAKQVVKVKMSSALKKAPQK